MPFPERIVSLVPSQTELLFDLGLDRQIVGITKFCIHPANKVSDRPTVGGTKTVDLNRIYTLEPDLIIANKEENTREQIEDLQRRYAVHVTDINTLPDALKMIREVGALVGKDSEAEIMANHIQNRLIVRTPPSTRSVAYFIWGKPYMVAASGTFINAMLETAGLVNAFNTWSRYPAITLDNLQVVKPDLIFLSSEPYQFREKHVVELQATCPAARIVRVDGEMFSWYGSRLLEAGDYLSSLHDELFSLTR